jgi:hypothetical protein
MEDLNKLNEILEISNTKMKVILGNLLHMSSNINNSVDISGNVYTDTLIDKWVEKLPTLDGGKILINNMIHNPINDKYILEERQKSYIAAGEIDFELIELKYYEKDILWTFVLNEEINDDYSINLLYFSNFLINKINDIEPILDLFHIYKIYFVPLRLCLFTVCTVVLIV